MRNKEQFKRYKACTSSSKGEVKQEDKNGKEISDDKNAPHMVMIKNTIEVKVEIKDLS